jgi:Arc-like DNA binding domain
MRARIARDKVTARLAVRVPKDVYDYISESARQASRSINYEVLVRLRASIEVDRIFREEAPEKKLAALERLKQRLIGLRLTAGDE